MIDKDVVYKYKLDFDNENIKKNMTNKSVNNRKTCWISKVVMKERVGQ